MIQYTEIRKRDNVENPNKGKTICSKMKLFKIMYNKQFFKLMMYIVTFNM